MTRADRPRVIVTGISIPVLVAVALSAAFDVGAMAALMSLRHTNRELLDLAHRQTAMIKADALVLGLQRALLAPCQQRAESVTGPADPFRSANR